MVLHIIRYIFCSKVNVNVFKPFGDLGMQQKILFGIMRPEKWLGVTISVGKTAFPVKLPGNIKSPFFKTGSISQRDQAFEFAYKRNFPKSPVIGSFYVIITACKRNLESPERLDHAVNLQAVRVGATAKIIKDCLLWVSVEIKHDLVYKMCMVKVSADAGFQCFCQLKLFRNIIPLAII